MQTLKKFKDIKKYDDIEGEKINFKDILNKEIIIEKMKNISIDTKFGKKDVTLLQIKNDNKTYKTLIFSEIIRKQLEMTKNNLPFIATIKKVKKYYTLE